MPDAVSVGDRLRLTLMGIDMTDAAFPLPSSDHDDEALSDRRLERRRDCRIIALVREFGRPGKQVAVENLSEHGCRLRGCNFAQNDELWIKFATVPPVKARVVWAHDGLAGCRFHEPLAKVLVALADLGDD